MSDALIKALVRKAEADQPWADVVIEVVAPATPSDDPNESAYLAIRRCLSGARRAKLEQDYGIWQVLHSDLRDLMAKTTGQMVIRDSPLMVRLSTMRMRPPTGWRLCSKCNGSGEGDIGYCRECKGNGYVV